MSLPSLGALAWPPRGDGGEGGVGGRPRLPGAPGAPGLSGQSYGLPGALRARSFCRPSNNPTHTVASTTTGVTLNPDGSATLTPKEWAKYSHLISGPSASTRRPIVRHDDDSSSEEERPLAARRRPPPGAASASTRRRIVRHDNDNSSEEERPLAARRRRRSEVDATKDNALFDMLNEDELASILNAIGRDDESKATACEDAHNFCSVIGGKACHNNPKIWIDLAKRIFDYRPAEDDNNVVFGKRLIYDTFRDDANPRDAFNSMCGATGLADVLEKRFVMFVSKAYGEMLWDRWADVRADVTGLGEAIEDLSGEEADKLAEEYDPDIFKADEWEADAKALFDSAPRKALYLKKYRSSASFSKLVNNLFKSTSKYLFEDPRAINNMDDDANAHDVLHMIGEMLGIYIVCLWKLERDRSDFDDKHGVDSDPMPADVFATLIDEKDVHIQNLRLRIAYAIDLILDPQNATDVKDYSDFTDFQQELYDYESGSEFDYGRDRRD